MMKYNWVGPCVVPYLKPMFKKKKKEYLNMDWVLDDIRNLLPILLSV